MTDEEMTSTMQSFMTAMRAKMEAKQQAAGVGQQGEGRGLPGREQEEGWLENDAERPAIQNRDHRHGREAEGHGYGYDAIPRHDDRRHGVRQFLQAERTGGIPGECRDPRAGRKLCK